MARAPSAPHAQRLALLDPDAGPLLPAEVSRGGSIVTHFAGDERAASFTAAVKTLADPTGPTY